MPWTKDDLKRENYGKTLDILIDNPNAFRTVSEKSLVIALNSGYGTGKSFFINMWSNHLKIRTAKKNTPLIVHINAWENDNFHNPLLPFISEIDRCLQCAKNDGLIDLKNNDLINNFRKASLKTILRFGQTITDHFLESKLGITTEKIQAYYDDVANDYNETKVTPYDSLMEEYNKNLNIKSSFKEVLEEITSVIPIIVIIDELDRCRPTYAIETLETIKHYFDVSNISYIFSIDLEQLSHSISTVYGQNMDSQGYLRKFFDVIISLPKPNIIEYFNYQIAPFNKSGKFNLNGRLSIAVEDNIKEFDLSLRDINTLLPSMKLLSLKLSIDVEHCTFNSFSIENPRLRICEAIFYLFFLKFKKLSSYNFLLNEVFYITDDNDRLSIPKSSMEGVNFLLEFLCNGRNKEFCSFSSTPNSGGALINHFCRSISDFSACKTPSQLLHNYIETSFSIFKPQNNTI